MQRHGSYEDLLAYLRHFVNFGGDPVPYDFNEVVHLMLAILDNLGHNALEAELEGVAESFSDEQAAFFLKLAGYLRRDRSSGDAGPGSIGFMRDAAEELDEIVADAMKQRREEQWRDIPVE